MCLKETLKTFTSYINGFLSWELGFWRKVLSVLAVTCHVPAESGHWTRGERQFWQRTRISIVFLLHTKRLFCKGVWLHPSQQCKDLKLKVFLKMAALMQRARPFVFFTRVTTNNRTEDLCIEVTWEEKGHFLFLKGEKNNCSVGRRQRSQCLMDCSIASPEHNQLLWLIMVRQLETKIILVQTRAYVTCTTRHRQLAGLKRFIQPRSSNHLIYFPVFPRGPPLFCRQKIKMKDATSMSKEKDVFLPLMTKDDQFEQSILSPFKN